MNQATKKENTTTTQNVVTVKDFMKQYKEEHKNPLPTDNMKSLTTREYAKLKGVHINTVQAMLKAGEIPNAEKFGGRYRIYVPDDNRVSFEEYQKVKDENIRLQALLDGIVRLGQQWREATP